MKQVIIGELTESGPAISPIDETLPLSAVAEPTLGL